MDMNKQTAERIVSIFWSHGTRHERLSQALQFLGISPDLLERCSNETRKVTRGLGPLILTPTSVGRRR